ncbi:MAG: phosphoribosylformylglycinamidine synthase I [Spirochaetota bacterium]
MAKPRALILTGYGINCDEETRYAFELAGAKSDIIHINEIIENKKLLEDYQVFSFPGGFSYGDDTGSGKALANKIKNNLFQEFQDFIERDTLMLGICNGFQVMANLGIVPAISKPIGGTEVSLEHNRTFRFQCRWVDLRIEQATQCVFTRGITRMHIPVAHAEGNLFASEDTIKTLEQNRQVVMRYTLPDGSAAGGEFPCNPNGSIHDIAAISNTTGRIMGMMPHPERHIFFRQRDDWTYLREQARRNNTEIPEEGEGVAIFRNAVSYFN